MREHMGLYRGKEKRTGKWIEGGLQVGVAHELWQNEGRAYIRVFPKYLSKPNLSEVDPETVGECTGLRDKNGKLIFEGDMCCNTRTGEIVSVKWHGTMAGFVWSKREEKSNWCDFGELFRAHDKYEIIGNIHDNPELLEGGANHAAD